MMLKAKHFVVFYFLTFALVVLTSASKSQSVKTNDFVNTAKQFNAIFTMPKGFFFLDTPSIYTIRDTSFSRRFTGTRKIDVWEDRLRCKVGITSGPILKRIISKDKKLVVSYSLSSYPKEADYNQQEVFFWKQVHSFTEPAMQKRYNAYCLAKSNADSGGEYGFYCDGIWQNLNNERVIYLSKKPSYCKKQPLNGIVIKIICQFHNDLLGQIDELIDTKLRTSLKFR